MWDATYVSLEGCGAPLIPFIYGDKERGGCGATHQTIYMLGYHSGWLLFFKWREVVIFQTMWFKGILFIQLEGLGWSWSSGEWQDT